MTTQNAIVNYKIGKAAFAIELQSDENAITGCRMLGRRNDGSAGAPRKGVMGAAAMQLKNYFAGRLNALEAPLALGGTEFQKMVWEAARTIPPGEVRSYAWLAAKVGNPRAVRAVASALGANPALLFVPCHRVLRSNGDLGGFSCGLEWKELLLEHERSR
jgi:methylated-DNA-[protein]-cysteine S-methyltransferase